MTRDQILNAADEEILAEIKSLHYLFRMTSVIRHGLNRDTEQFKTQSDAEHIYDMQILCQYFLPLEDPNNNWDHHKINQMILFHDLAEIETGDYMTHEKVCLPDNIEHEAITQVIANSPTQLEKPIKDILDEYELRQSVESRFVKALDCLEAVLDTMTPRGLERRRDHMQLSKTEAEFYEKKNHSYTKDFPTVARFIQLEKKFVLDKTVANNILLDLQNKPRDYLRDK